MIKCHLKTILKEHNLSQKELCALIKARPSTVCDWCNNNVESIPQVHEYFSSFSKTSILLMKTFTSSEVSTDISTYCYAFSMKSLMQFSGTCNFTSNVINYVCHSLSNDLLLISNPYLCSIRAVGVKFP